MSEERPIHTVPTELDRSDGFLDLAGLAATGLVVWQLALYGVPWWLMVLPTSIVAVWVLTGEPAADVPYLGAIAAALRSRLGLRRAHEWVFAAFHWWHLAVYPVWRSECEAFLASSRRRITSSLARLNATMRCRGSLVCSWAYRIRWRSSARPEA